MSHALRHRRPTTVVMVPSCAGGIGHISRCAALAGALQQLDPTVRVEFVLDTERLWPFNVEATARMGFQPRLLAPRTREIGTALLRLASGRPTSSSTTSHAICCHSASWSRTQLGSPF